MAKNLEFLCVNLLRQNFVNGEKCNLRKYAKNVCYIVLEKLRTFTQKIHKFLYVKPRFLPQNSSILQENRKVELFRSSGRIFTHRIFSNDFHLSRLITFCAFKNENNSTYLKFWVGGKIRTSKFWPILSQSIFSYLRSGLKMFLLNKINLSRELFQAKWKKCFSNSTKNCVMLCLNW